MSHALLVTRQNIWWREYPELIQRGPLSSASKAGALRVLSRSTLSLSSHFYFDFRHQTFIFIMRGLSELVIDVEFRAPVPSYCDAGWRICQLKLINWISWRQLRYSLEGWLYCVRGILFAEFFSRRNLTRFELNHVTC